MDISSPDKIRNFFDSIDSIDKTFEYIVIHINKLLYTKNKYYFLYINGTGGGCEDGFTSLINLCRTNLKKCVEILNGFTFKYINDSRNVNITHYDSTFNHTIIFDNDKKDYNMESIKKFVDSFIVHINIIENAYQKLSKMFNLDVFLSMHVVELGKSRWKVNDTYQIDYDMNNKFILQKHHYDKNKSVGCSITLSDKKVFDNIDDLIKEILREVPRLEKKFINRFIGLIC
jgi:hypothetical protein